LAVKVLFNKKDPADLLARAFRSTCDCYKQTASMDSESQIQLPEV
jgi:hypothetical protein